MRVLIACEFSGIVRDAFTTRGHDAMSCDLLPSETQGNHYQGDVVDVMYDDWDLMIAHPPCTYLCNSGVQHLHKDIDRWFKLFEGGLFFKKFLHSDIPKVVIENPIMHGYAKQIIGVNQSQVIQPWMFGHVEQKATCLWIKGLPLLKQTNNVKEKMMKLSSYKRQRSANLSPSKARGKLRSITLQGVADAMADQWG